METEFVAILAWEPYSTVEETKKAIIELEAHPTVALHRYLLAIPFPFLETLTRDASTTPFTFGAIAMNNVAQGSFTETIAARLLKEANAKFVLLGTAFNRKLGFDDNDLIRKKIRAALESDIIPIVCLGDTLEEHQAGRSEEILRKQLQECLHDLTGNEWKKLQIVYEAPWINETSFIPPLEEILQGYTACRHLIKGLFGEELTAQTPLLCALPNDVKDLSPFISNIPCEGFFFGKASTNLEILCEGLHMTTPQMTSARQQLETPDSVKEASIQSDNGQSPPVEEETNDAEFLGEAVLAAAKETEKQEPPPSSTQKEQGNENESDEEEFDDELEMELEEEEAMEEDLPLEEEPEIEQGDEETEEQK